MFKAVSAILFLALTSLGCGQKGPLVKAPPEDEAPPAVEAPADTQTDKKDR